MIVRLVARSLRQGKARFACAAAGIAVAAGAIAFTSSLVATNNAQAPILAARAAMPWRAWETGCAPEGGAGPAVRGGMRGPRADSGRGAARAAANAPLPDLRLQTLPLTIDYRPGGHVLQGPPMRALMADAPRENPYAAVSLAEGRWVNEDSGEPEVVCVRSAMRRFGAAAPALGEPLKFVGRNGTMTARIVGYLDGADRLPPQFPTVFANTAALSRLAGEERGYVSFYKSEKGLAACGDSAPQAPPNAASSPASDRPARAFFTPSSEGVVAAFKSDEQRRMDYARPLMLIAAVLTALSLLVNSLLLSVEANRRELAILRMVGLTRQGVAGFVWTEAMAMGLSGWLIGVAGGALALLVFVAAEGTAFPAGAAFDTRAIAATLAVLPFVVLAAVLFALRPAMKVRPVDALNAAPRTRRHGMAVTFALGFAAFVAVEVWGASLMRAFVPSPEWPDAIVSLLPGGASSFDIGKLRGIEGVARISELLPLQVRLPAVGAGAETAEIESAGAGGAAGGSGASPRGPRRGFPNALFLAAEWLPRFRFVEGEWEAARKGIEDGGVVICEMMSRARNLHLGDSLVLADGGPAPLPPLPVVGVADINWHMVTSRGLVRGLNRMPPMTDGPVFASFDTVESLDRRPAPMVRMTHLWVEYEPGFLARHGVFQAGRIIEAEIARRLGNPAEATVRLHARDEIADGTLAHGSDVIGAAARVPFVFLAILAIGFVAMLVAEADARKRELAVLRAVGATRGQLALRLAARAAKTALAGVAAGVPVGALAGWLASIRTAAIWPGLPHWFVVPWRIVAEGAWGALVFALVFALPTSLSLVGRITKRRG